MAHLSENQQAANREQAGFTLVEMLVATALLSLLSLMLFAGLRFGAQAWNSTDTKLAALSEVSFAQSFLRGTIANAYPKIKPDGKMSGTILFDGQNDSLTFLALTPLSHSLAGRSKITIGARPGERNGDIVVTFEPELASDLAASREQAEIILSNVIDISFAYFGSKVRSVPPQWQNEWQDITKPPALVKVSLELEENDPRIWPDLIIATSVDVDQSCSFDPLTKFCKGR